MKSWRTAMSRADAGVPAHDWREHASTMTRESDDAFREARRKGVRRTVWIAGSIAVVIFVLSIVQMIKG
jgi:hypothetical protein